MSTRSNIGILNQDGSVTFIYCHFDGYPKGVGAMLRKYYTVRATVESLLALGDISSLNKNLPTAELVARIKDLKEGVRRDVLEDNMCVIPYGLWRGEDVPAKTEPLADFVANRIDWAEYKYVFNPETNKWKTYNMV